MAALILGALGIGGALLSGWSLTTLMLDAGAPWWVAGLAVTVLDGLALVAGLMVYLRRSAPHTAAGAQLVLLLAVLASATVNAAHGLVMPGGGWMAAVVLGAAPLAWEIGFALRHRTLTVLIWLWWGKEARTALRREAWERIAPVAAPAEVTVERADQEQPERDVDARQDALERAVTALARARAVSGPTADPADVAWAAERADAALDGARAHGWTLAEVMEADARVQRRIEAAAERGRIRPEASGRPEDRGSALVKGRVPSPEIRTETRRRPSVAEGVRSLAAAGVTDPETIAERLEVALGQPVRQETVARYLRDLGDAQQRPEQGRGGYI
jgi:hypothetical protein